MKDKYILLALIVVGYFIGLGGAPITDPVEGNYALTAKEMLDSGDYISPRIYGVYWYDKPVLYYLELVASYALLGVSDFSTRLPSAVMAAAGLVMTYLFTWHIYDRARALVATVILGTSLEFWAIGHGVITDMTLFVLNAGVLIAFYLGYTERKYSYYLLAFAAAGLAVLTKGPIGLCLPGLIILLFLLWQRDIKALFRWQIAAGFVVFLAVAALWYVPMYLRHGSDFIMNFIGVHNVLRATVSEHPEYDYWFYYLVVALLGLFPWSVPVAIAGVKRWRAVLSVREWWGRLATLDVRTRFLLTWAVTVFAVFQSFATKYFSYTFPYMLPLAILLAGFFLARRRLFTRMAIGILGVYVILMFTVVPERTEYRSSRDISEFVQPYLTEDTELLFCEHRYMTSSVLYTGRLTGRLLSAEARESERPDGVSWKAKNVMPMVTYAELPLDKNIIVVGKKDTRATLEAEVPGSWRLLGTIPTKKDCYIYYRSANIK